MTLPRTVLCVGRWKSRAIRNFVTTELRVQTLASKVRREWRDSPVDGPGYLVKRRFEVSSQMSHPSRPTARLLLLQLTLNSLTIRSPPSVSQADTNLSTNVRPKRFRGPSPGEEAGQSLAPYAKAVERPYVVRERQRHERESGRRPDASDG